jgi:hypothetical protein
MPPTPNLLERDDHARAVITWALDLPEVRAGSALVQSGERLLVAQDDAFTLFWLHDLDPAPPGRLPRLESIPLLPRSGPLAKSEKPDFEAAADLPDGRIVVIGSGSSPARNYVVVMDPDRCTYEMRDASRIYDIVGKALGHELNIEAMLWVGEAFRLFHRGNAGDGDATIDVAVDPDDPREVDVRAIASWDLGRVPGENGPVRLTFTDADLDPTGRQWFLAAAEDTANAIDDGPVVGASLGYLRGNTGRWTMLRDPDGSPSTRKAEGLVIEADMKGGWLVTDPDDEDACAELCRIELSGWPD